VTGTGGTFQITGLRDGKYRLCAQVPGTAWLNPCQWALQPIAVALSDTQPTASVTIVMKKGAAVPIRVDDPGQLLSQHEGKTAGAHLLVGVGNDAFAFAPARVMSQDATGRNLEVVIPFNSTAKISVLSSFFRLADATGLPLPKTGVTIPILVPAGQRPPAITLRVTGVGP